MESVAWSTSAPKCAASARRRALFSLSTKVQTVTRTKAITVANVARVRPVAMDPDPEASASGGWFSAASLLAEWSSRGGPSASSPEGCRADAPGPGWASPTDRG